MSREAAAAETLSLDFRECPSCSAVGAGAIRLCESCVHNRWVIGLLKSTLANNDDAHVRFRVETAQSEQGCTCKTAAGWSAFYCRRHGR